MNVFDIIGPIMVGPSSSHTAGAVRIALVAAAVINSEIKKADITFHGSFAHTYKGHGTDKAIIGGLMGFKTDDSRIRDSLHLAEVAGIQVSIHSGDLGEVHPNTVLLEVESPNGKKASILGSSIGGGSIRILAINGVEVDFNAQNPTLLIEHKDKPGMVAAVSNVLGVHSINIGGMRLYRSRKGGLAMMIIETDQMVQENFVEDIRKLVGINQVFSVFVE